MGDTDDYLEGKTETKGPEIPVSEGIFFDLPLKDEFERNSLFEDKNFDKELPISKPKRIVIKSQIFIDDKS